MENEIYFKAVQFEKKTITDFEKWYLKEKEKIISQMLGKNPGNFFDS